MKQQKLIRRRGAVRASGRRRGSTLVEFALIAPLLLLISLGIVQYGVITNATNTLTNIAREGARFAAIKPGTSAAPNDGDTGLNPGSGTIRNHVKNVCAATTIRFADIDDPSTGSGSSYVAPRIDITTPDSGGRIPGNRIVVTITYPMSRKLFAPNKLLGFRFFPDTYTSTATFVIE